MARFLFYCFHALPSHRDLWIIPAFHSLVPAVLPDESDTPSIFAGGISTESLLIIPKNTAAQWANTAPTPKAGIIDPTDHFHANLLY